MLEYNVSKHEGKADLKVRAVCKQEGFFFKRMTHELLLIKIILSADTVTKSDLDVSKVRTLLLYLI